MIDIGLGVSSAILSHVLSGMAVGAVSGSVAPGVGTATGAAVGVLVGIGVDIVFYLLTEVLTINGKSIVDWTKYGLAELVSWLVGGKHMNTELYKIYIDYGFNVNQNCRDLMKGAFAINILAILGGVFGLFINSRTLICSILIYFFAIVSMVWLCCVIRCFDTQKYKQIRFKTITSINASLVFILNAMIFCEMLEPNSIHFIILGSFPMMIACFSILIDYFNLKKEKYLNHSNIKRVNISRYAASGAIIGFWIARTLLNDLNQNNAIIVLILIFLFLSFVFSFGCSNILRVYYIRKIRKKYNIDITQ